MKGRNAYILINYSYIIMRVYKKLAVPASEKRSMDNAG